MTEKEPVNDPIAPETDVAPTGDGVTTVVPLAPEPVMLGTEEAAAVATPDATVEAVVVEPVIATAGMAATRPSKEKEEEPRRQRRPAKPSSLQPLPPYAIIETGGKQYRVSIGDVLSVEKLPVEAGGTITFDRVLLLSGDGETRVGTPVVDGASVAATVEETYRGEKIIVFKFKAKKHYRRKTGHRQSLTRLAITAINA